LWRGPAFLYNPVKQLSLIQPSLIHIDSGLRNSNMNADDSCCKTWMCTAAHPVALRTVSGSCAIGYAKKGQIYFPVFSQTNEADFSSNLRENKSAPEKFGGH